MTAYWFELTIIWYVSLFKESKIFLYPPNFIDTLYALLNVNDNLASCLDINLI